MAKQFSIGQVVSDTFKTLRDNLVTLGSIALLLVVAPEVVLAILQLIARHGGVLVGAGVGFVVLLGSLGSIFLSTLAQAAMIYLEVNALGGRTVGFSEALAKGMGFWWPVLLISFCIGALGSLGLLLLVVPGILMLLRWSVAIPARIIENSQGLTAMARSVELTQGHRWKIFVLFLVIAIILFLIEGLFAVIFIHPFAAGFAQVGATPIVPVFSLVIGPLLNLVLLPFITSLISSLYYELRMARDGMGTETLAAVFE